MKVILFIAVFALFSSFCASEETAPAEQVDEFNADFDNQIQDVSDATEEAAEDNDEESDETEQAVTEKLDAKTEQAIKSQGVGIRVTKRGQIVITVGHGKGSRWTTYIRWGKRSCRRGATLVYEGYVGGSWYGHRGDSSGYLCLPRDPQYRSTQTIPIPHSALIYGSEYQSWNRALSGVTHDWNVPCAVCKVRKQHTMMIPAKYTCPSGWYREYHGYLMTEHYNHVRSGSYTCVDAVPDRIGSSANTDGALFYFVRLHRCNAGIPCSGNGYIAGRPLTCVVCSKA